MKRRRRGEPLGRRGGDPPEEEGGELPVEVGVNLEDQDAGYDEKEDEILHLGRRVRLTQVKLLLLQFLSLAFVDLRVK